jgi:23S rRNA pseudouridine1911/1915/1917 synthase
LQLKISIFSDIGAMESTLGTAPVVVYEDNHLIAIQKPFGMPSQNDASGDLSANDWVMAYLRDKYQKPGNVYVGLLHRLDRPAGGLLVFAKTSKAAERMSTMFQQRAVDKRYLVVTLAVPSPRAGRLQHYVAPVPGQLNIMRAYDQPGGERKLAALTYVTLRTQGGRALVEIELETGRKHQIRLQMAKIGCGIVGDARYNETAFLPDRSIALFAWKISFMHPVRKEERVELELAPPRGGVWEI